MANIASLILTLIIISVLMPYVKKYLGKYQIVVEQRKVKEQEPSWIRGLTILLFLLFFIPSLIVSVGYISLVTGSEIKSIFEIILFFLVLINLVLISALLCNMVLWIIPATRKAEEKAGVSFKKFNMPFIKGALFLVPITLIYLSFVLEFSL